MRTLRVALVLTVALALAAAASAAPGNAKGKGKGKKGHGVHGVVAKVDNDGNHGTITVKVKAKKGGTAAEKTFKVTKGTTFQRVSGKKGEKQTGSAVFADVKAGERVAIVARGDVAEKVTITGKAKKKAKAAKANK
ncbi:MAG TPA: hypothetical protein VFA26_13815 [Gemmataceae bacterium]|nr:hypothetical protein [Gemmataceae bacterium]